MNTTKQINTKTKLNVLTNQKKLNETIKELNKISLIFLKSDWLNQHSVFQNLILDPKTTKKNGLFGQTFEKIFLKYLSEHFPNQFSANEHELSVLTEKTDFTFDGFNFQLKTANSNFKTKKTITIIGEQFPNFKKSEKINQDKMKIKNKTFISKRLSNFLIFFYNVNEKTKEIEFKYKIFEKESFLKKIYNENKEITFYFNTFSGTICANFNNSFFKNLKSKSIKIGFSKFKKTELKSHIFVENDFNEFKEKLEKIIKTHIFKKKFIINYNKFGLKITIELGKYGKNTENFFKRKIKNSKIENYFLNQFEFLNFCEAIDFKIQKTPIQLKTRNRSSGKIGITSNNFNFQDLEKSKEFINNSLVSIFLIDIQEKKDNELQANFYIIPKLDLQVIIKNNKLKFENKLISLYEHKTKNRDSVFYEFRPNGKTIVDFNEKYKIHSINFTKSPK